MNITNCEHCSTEGACPFAFNDESEQVQGYGCLPTPWEIVKMRQEHGKTWACHQDYSKPCLGAIKYQKEKGLEYKVINPVLVTDRDDWSVFI